MDMSKLAQMMLEWESKKRALDELESAIKDAVLQLGKTQTVGNVRASYSAGRKRYDYKGAGELYAPPSVIELHTRKEVDWRAVCKDAGLSEEIEYTQGDPSVSVKLI